MFITQEKVIKKAKSVGRNFINKFRNRDQSLTQLSCLYEKYKTYTMIPHQVFFDNLKLCHNFRHEPGCIVECGVWRGGMIAAMAELLGNERNYYLFDSFEGLPEAKEIDGSAAINWQNDKESPIYYDNCRAEVIYTKQAMQLSGVINYQINKGWFSETLPKFNLDEPIAILRLDADWYDSTMQCLSFLYPKVRTGGLIILDDYYMWDGCSRAVHDYLSAHKLADKIQKLNELNCYILKK